MCLRLTVLTHARPGRMVTQCEHGTLHLSWDIATIHLGQSDFRILAQFLERWIANGEPLAFGEGWCQVVRDGRGAMRLWIGQAGLAIGPDDVETFLELIHQGVEVLRAGGVGTAAPRHNIQRCPLLKTDTAALIQN